MFTSDGEAVTQKHRDKRDSPFPDSVDNNSVEGHCQRKELSIDFRYKSWDEKFCSSEGLDFKFNNSDSSVLTCKLIGPSASSLVSSRGFTIYTSDR